MSFFFTLFKTALLSRRRGWFLLFLLPLTAFGARALLPPEEVSTPVQAGVVLPKSGGEIFWQRLEERSGLVVTFHRAALSQAEGQVAAGRWDCALVLPDDLEQRLAALDNYELIDLLIGPGSTAYPLVRETAAACVAELAAPAIAEDYLLERGIADETSIAALRPRLRETLADQDRVHVSLETLDGRPLDPLVLADSGVDVLLSGLTAILLLVWALLAAMDLGRWLDSPFVRRLLPLRSVPALLPPRLGAALVPALCAGALALLAADHPLPWGAVALAMARLRPVWSALPALLPFVPVLGLVLSPVLLDLSPIFPALGPVIRWNPVTLYLRACGGSWQDGAVLAAAGGVLLALPLLLKRKQA